MQFANNAHIENLLKDAQKLGATLVAGELDRIGTAIQNHEFYTIASAEGEMVAEGISVAQNGDFLCVMIDTRSTQPVSWARQSFANFLGADDSVARVCEALETVRQTYLRWLASNKGATA